MSLLGQLLGLSTDAFWTLALAFFRVGAMMFLVPGFGEMSLPMRVRLAAAFAFTVLYAPLMPPHSGIPDLVVVLPIILSEVSAGVFFAILLRFFIFALQVAGSIAAQSTSLSQIFGGTPGLDPQPALGQVLVMAGIALAMASDLHLLVFAYLETSYDIWPLGRFPQAQDLSRTGVEKAGAAFSLGFQLAAPFVLASMLYNVTLGVINRAMPQLMVSFVGAPAITAGGLVLAALTSATVLSIWLTQFRQALAAGGI